MNYRTAFVLVVASSTCFAQFQTQSPTVEPSAIPTACATEATEFGTCAHTATSAPPNFEDCGSCLGTKVSYSGIAVDTTCDDISTYILNEYTNCQAECFPSTYECSDHYQSMAVCIAVDALAGYRCGSNGDADGTPTNGEESDVDVGPLQTQSPTLTETASPTAAVTVNRAPQQTQSPALVQTASPTATATVNPSIVAGTTCGTEVSAFYSCVDTSTAPPVDNDACDACLEAKVDYNPTVINLLSAPCDDLSTFLFNEANKCEAECFPPSHDCTDDYLVLFECYFIEAVAQDRCGSGNDSSGDEKLDRMSGDNDTSGAVGRMAGLFSVLAAMYTIIDSLML